MYPLTKVPVTFNHEYNADAYINGIIEYREMANRDYPKGHYNYEKGVDKPIITPYSKERHLIKFHLATGLSRKECKEAYDNAVENERGEKYYHDMKSENMFDNKEPDIFKFLIDSLKSNSYVKSLTR